MHIQDQTVSQLSLLFISAIFSLLCNDIAAEKTAAETSLNSMRKARYLKYHMNKKDHMTGHRSHSFNIDSPAPLW